MRCALPPDFAAKHCRPKQDDARLMRLLLGAPAPARGTADAWLDWYAGLTVGAAAAWLALVRVHVTGRAQPSLQPSSQRARQRVAAALCELLTRRRN